MEKTLRTLNVTMNKNGDAKMMMMALVNHSLATKMGCSNIVTEIMDDVSVELSQDEKIFVTKRIIAAVNKYHDSKVSCNSKEQRYEKLMSLVTSEVGKETDIMRMIYSDISERYDISELSTSEVAEVSCWLAVKSILWVLPATESLVAAQTYKKQRRDKEDSASDKVVVEVVKDDKQPPTELVVIEQPVKEPDSTTDLSAEDATVEVLTALFSEENIRNAVHKVMVDHNMADDTAHIERVDHTTDTSKFSFVPLRWMSMVNCVK